MVEGTLNELGRLVDNYEIDATGATAKWPTDKKYVATVPVGKRWYFYGGICFRDQASTMTVALKNASDKIILYLADHGSASGIAHYPESANTGGQMQPIPMDVGFYIEITLGTSQTSGAYASCVVIEVDI